MNRLLQLLNRLLIGGFYLLTYQVAAIFAAKALGECCDKLFACGFTSGEFCYGQQCMEILDIGKNLLSGGSEPLPFDHCLTHEEALNITTDG